MISVPHAVSSPTQNLRSAESDSITLHNRATWYQFLNRTHLATQSGMEVKLDSQRLKWGDLPILNFLLKSKSDGSIEAIVETSGGRFTVTPENQLQLLGSNLPEVFRTQLERFAQQLETFPDSFTASSNPIR